MLLPSKTGLTDWVQGRFRLNLHPCAELSLEQPLYILAVQMGKPMVPQCHIKWTCAHQTNKVSLGLHSAIQRRCIVRSDRSSEQSLRIANERNASRINHNIEQLVPSEVQDG